MDDEEFKIFLLLWLWRKRQQRIQHRRSAPRWWVRPILTNRLEQGAYSNLVAELRNDVELFFNYHRMTPNQFDTLLHKIEPQISKLYLTREPLPPGLRLFLTLRYIAAGDSMASLHYQYRIGRATTSKIIAETTKVIWDVLHPEVLPVLKEEEWASIAQDFGDIWNFQNCVGAIDGKHVVVQCFKNTGSTFYNYKGTFSIVLLAACDTQYRFIYVSIGSAGKESDGGIFQSSDFGKDIIEQKLPLPPPTVLHGSNTRVPFVFVGDAAFPLLENLMRPYPGVNLTPDQIIFNYRESRARMCIENACGVMTSRFRIFRKPIIASLETVQSIVQCCVVLHNWLRDSELHLAPGQRRYLPPCFVDREDRSGNLQIGQWREENEFLGLRNLNPNAARNSTQVAKEVREIYKNYFMAKGSVQWQWDKLPEHQKNWYLQQANN
ncbi:uncharacterized protein [Temnothorax longispinosus]|uniref:uncharacterized protein n=1 Tax=Temnothorax longispinosus TaxID=300112 RepID=UPI003A995CF4